MTEKEDPWQGYDPNAPAEEESPEQRVRALEQWVWEMQQAQKAVPKILVLKQGAALAFILVNLWFLYTNMGSSVAGYIAAYMLPLSALLLDYFLVVAELKRIAAGKKKNEDK